MDCDTLFEIGSITKTFTASLLVDMVRRREIRLDDPVADDLPASVRVPERGGRKITLLDLATHTSGLPGLPTNIHPRDLSNPYADYTEELLDQFLSGYPLTREIGSKYEYSAVGMALLGRALGHRLTMNWERALTERILKPLGMTSTRATLTPTLQLRLAPGHDENGKPASNWDVPALPAMGALHSSAKDMTKYLVANMDPIETLRPSLRWSTCAKGRDGRGDPGGYRSLIAVDTAQGLGVIVLTNFASGADDIGFHLLDPSLPLQ